MELKAIESAETAVVYPSQSYTSHRLLVGNPGPAESTLAQGLKRLSAGKTLLARPIVVVHPVEKVEHGLSDVEDRVLRELTMAAGARKVAVWVGHELSDAEVAAQVTRA